LQFEEAIIESEETAARGGDFPHSTQSIHQAQTQDQAVKVE